MHSQGRLKRTCASVELCLNVRSAVAEDNYAGETSSVSVRQPDTLQLAAATLAFSAKQ